LGKLGKAEVIKMVAKLNVQVPADLAAVLDVSKEQLSREALKLMVFELFREGRISAGKAAALLGISRLTFMELLAERNVPFFNYSEEDLEEELKAIEDIRAKLKEEEERGSCS